MGGKGETIHESYGLLPWGWSDNRPFLHRQHVLGLCLWRLGRFEEAGRVFDRMLWLNRSDTFAPAQHGKIAGKNRRQKPDAPPGSHQPSLPESRASLQLENLALRHQIGILQRSAKKRPKLTAADRILWAWLSGVWAGWRSALVIVKPETVIASHRKGLRRTAQARHRHRGDQRGQVQAPAPETAVPDLANPPGEPPQEPGVRRFLHGADDPVPGTTATNAGRRENRCAASFFLWDRCVARAGCQCANPSASATMRIRLSAPPQNPLTPLKSLRVPAVFHLATACAQPLCHSDRVYDRHNRSAVDIGHWRNCAPADPETAVAAEPHEGAGGTLRSPFRPSPWQWLLRGPEHRSGRCGLWFRSGNTAPG